jgi:Protein phosphatase 2C
VFGKGPSVELETARVLAAGGWVADGRVCDVLAVSRAFGDWEFKGEGLPVMLGRGLE